MKIINTTTAKVAFLAVLFSHSASLACGLRLTEPKSHFDGVDSLGHVSLIEKLGQLDAGKSKLPVFLIFNSGNPRISPYVGASFDIPLLSSRIEAVDENTFKFYEPDGWYQTFWRDPKDPNILNGGSGWKAEIKGDTISAWADCGKSKATFVKGKITELEVDGAKFDYVYNGSQVSEIRMSGAPVLKVLTDASTGQVTGLSLGTGEVVNFVEDKKPKVQNIGGKNLISAVERSLSQIVLADGTKKDFTFSIDDQIRPTVKVDGERVITWDPATSKIIQDADWAYDVKPITDNFDNSQITRTNQQGKKESWWHDGIKGEDVIRHLDGTILRTQWFTSGVLYGKARNVTKTENGKEIPINTWSYDENGRLVRSYDVLSGPHTFTYSYDQQGRQTDIKRDGQTYTSKTYDEHGRLASESTAGRTIDYKYFIDGSISQTISSKGKLVVEQRLIGGHVIWRRGPDGKVFTFNYLPSGRLESTTDDKGNVLKFVYNVEGQITAQLKNNKMDWQLIEEPESRKIIKVIYGESGEVITAFDPTMKTKKEDAIAQEYLRNLKSVTK